MFHDTKRIGVEIHDDKFFIILKNKNFDKLGIHLFNKEGHIFYGLTESKERAIALSYRTIE